MRRPYKAYRPHYHVVMIIDMYMGHYHHHPNCSAATSSRHGLGLGTATREEIGFRLISLREF